MQTLELTKHQIFHQQFEKIKDELPVLFDKLQNQSDLSSYSQELLIKEMLKFLFLIGKHKVKLTPSLLVDYTWHEFILCTRFYMDFCNENYERYIHHHPGGGKEENHHQYIQTIKLYYLEFGDAPMEIWGDYLNEKTDSSDCGSCFSS